jgi:hypothetical protein
MARQYELLWPDCKIKHLVLSTEEFIVFVNDELDVDWVTNEKYDEAKQSDPIKWNAAINSAALLEATPCDGISPEVKLQFKRLIGEAVARSFDGDYSGASHMLDAARAYILARSQELARRWYLSASMVTALPFGIFGCILWWERIFFIRELGIGAFWLALTSVTGAMGALLSVIQRSGRLTVDCSAGRTLHWLEASSRILAGGIAGVLAGLAVRSEIILAALARGERGQLVMVLAAFVAGTGERFVTSIIAQVTATGDKSVASDDAMKLSV